MGNSKLNTLRDKLMEELEKHSKEQELTPACLEVIYKLSESIKAIDTISAMEDYDEDEGYSSRRRDAMGRYRSGKYPFRSYDDGREHMISKLRSMMQETGNERTRHALRNAINELEME